MKCKKLLSTLLAISVSVSSFAAATITASADGTKKTMNFGTDVISASATNAKDRDIIYYGDQKKWRVLSTNGNTTQNGQTTETATYTDDNGNDIKGPLFVISENDFGTRVFNTYDNNVWANSYSKTWCDGEFYTASGITDTEKAAILTTSKTDAAYSAYCKFKATSINDKVFYLSANEATTYFSDNEDRNFTLGGEAAMWWLRSGEEEYEGQVGYVHVYDVLIGSCNFENDGASRPAFNLNLSSVLFTSAADFTGGTVEEYTGNDWKLTLKDSNRSITIGDVARKGNKVTVNYSGATTGANAKVAYIVTNADKTEIKAYGNADASASGSIDATLPQNVADDDKLFVFSEQDNGAKKTNYASQLKEVTIPADSFAVTANVNDDTMGSVTSSKAIAKAGEGVTLTATANAGYKLVGFTSDDVKIGITGNEGMFTMPEKDVTVTANFAATTGENTITAKSNFDGMGTVTSDKATAAYGEEVTLTAVANDGNTFVEFASPDVEIGEDGKFIMPDKPVYVQAIFKANASFTANATYPIQAQKSDDKQTATLRFMWDLEKADGAYIANIGAYIIPWNLFDNKEAAKPSIVLVPSPNAKDGDTFSADYINIPTSDFGTDFCAIPFINGTFFAQGLLYGNVNKYNVDQAK